MPSEQTKHDWIFQVFTLSRGVNEQNSAVLNDELSIATKRYMSDARSLTEILKKVDFGITPSIFDSKDQAYGFRAIDHNILLSEIVLSLSRSKNLAELKSTVNMTISEQQWQDILLLTSIALSVFERWTREVRYNTRIYSKDVLSYKLFAYQLIATQENYDLLANDISNYLKMFVDDWNEIIGSDNGLKGSTIFGMVSNRKRSPAVMLGWRLAEQELLLSEILLQIQPESIPSLQDITISLGEDDWQYIFDFLGYFLMSLEIFNTN